MSFYFRPFAGLYYPSGKDYKLATDILRRVKFSKGTKQQEHGFIRHTIKDGDRPEHLAARFYGAANLHWVILIANEIINPYEDWPLSSWDLEQAMLDKYGDCLNDAHHFELADGTIVDIYDWLALDPDCDIDLYTENNEQIILYLGQIFNETVFTVTNREYEIKKNDAKRDIILLRPEFVQEAISQLNTLVR